MRKTSRRIWSVFLVALAFGTLVLALGIYARSGFGPLVVLSTDSMVVHTDFDTFWYSAEALWDGRSIYDTGARSANRNPPFWTVLISPLVLLEPLVAYRVFVLITLLTTVGYLAWMADELQLRAGWAVVGVGMLLCSSPLLQTLVLGQVYPILALGLVGAWVADYRNRPKGAGAALGLVVAIKPQLAPVVLWPLVRRRWGMFAATLASGAVATLVGIVVAGPSATIEWFRVLADVRLDGTWDNASLPGTAARLFTENDFADPIATLPWVEPATYILGVGIIILTAIRVRQGSETGLWALVAASLLASPIGWYSYLVLFGPGILLLLARGRVAPALLLLALQSIPPQWSEPWQDEGTVIAALALTLYLYILIALWLAFLTHDAGAKDFTASGPALSAPRE